MSHLHMCSDSARHWFQDICPPISQTVLKNFIKINLIIECPEEILIKLLIVLKISKTSWNTEVDISFQPYWHLQIWLFVSVASARMVQNHWWLNSTCQIRPISPLILYYYTLYHQNNQNNGFVPIDKLMLQLANILSNWHLFIYLFY